MSRERKSSRGTKPNLDAISEKKRKRKPTAAAVAEPEKEIITEMIVEEPEMIIDPVRRLIGKELLDTEKTYVTHLELLINGYKTPMEQSNKLSSKEIKLLFSNVEDIFDLQTDLFSKISKKIGESPDDFIIGEIFIDLSVYLSIYITYCCNYTASNKFLADLKHGTFLSYFREQQQTVGCDISDLLILPIQRIPRYRLLLASLLEHTHELHPDYNPIKEALKKTEDVADRINRSIKELLARQQAIDFSIKLRGKLTITEDFLQPHRIFISSHPMNLVDCIGTNAEKKEKADKKVEIYLFNDMIVITVVKGNDIEWINHAYLHHSMLKKSFGESATPLRFHYVNPENCFTLAAETEEQRDSFTTAVKTALQTLLETRPSLAAERKLVKLSQNTELGVWEAIKIAPRFADRITVEQLQLESEIETKKALDELMDLYSTIESPRTQLDKTPIKESAAKRATTKFRQISTLSPLKSQSAKKHKKANPTLTSVDRAEINAEIASSSVFMTPKEKRKSKSLFGISNIENEANSPLRVNQTNSPHESPKRLRENEAHESPFPSAKKTKMFVSPQSSPSKVIPDDGHCIGRLIMEVKYFQVTPDVKLAYNILHCANAKFRPFVLVQGLTGVKEDWLGFEKEIAKDRHVLFFDNRGMGQSSVPPGAYSIRLLAQDVIQLIKHVGWDLVDLMGVSMGGMICQTVALLEPTLIGKLVLGCTTLNATVDANTSAPLPLKGSGKGNSKRDFVAGFVDICLDKRFRIDHPEKFNEYVDHSMKYRRSIKGGMSQMSGILKFHNKNAKKISQKVLVLHGDQDRLIHCDRGIALAKEIPNARLVVLKDCGHNFWWTHQEVTLKNLFAFLNHDSSL